MQASKISNTIKIENDGVFVTISYRDQGETKELILGQNFVDLNDLDEYLQFAIKDYEIGDWSVVEMEKYAARLYRSAMKTKSQASLRLTLNEFALEVLSKEAKTNGQSIQSELTQRLRSTLYNDIEYRVRAIELKQAKIRFSAPKTFSFPIERNMLDLLAGSASVDKRSLDDEVLLRLLVSFVNPTEMELINHSNALIHRHIIHEEKERQRISSMANLVRTIDARQNKGAR